MMSAAEAPSRSQVTAAQTGIKLLLWNLQSPVNTGMLLRVAETYRVQVALCDCDRLLADAKAMSTVSDFACGALQRQGFSKLHGIAEADAWRGTGRLLATSIERDAKPLSTFHFQSADVVVLGNEYDGLPEDILARADCRITIPMANVWTPKPKALHPIDPSRTSPVKQDGSPSLNVAISGAIICYAAFAQSLTGLS